MNYEEVISKGKEQKSIFYKEYGSFTGDFLLITENGNQVFIYKGSYGSCAGCDELENFQNYLGEDFWTEKKIEEFSKDYEPFLVCDKETFLRCLKEGTINSILPANTRLNFEEDYIDISDSKVWADVYNSIGGDK